MRHRIGATPTDATLSGAPEDQPDADARQRTSGGDNEGVRLVSLLPSATEIVYALGLGDQLVGVTFECDQPPEARIDKTVVVGGRDTRGMTPAQIDAYVKQQLAAGA